MANSSLPSTTKAPTVSSVYLTLPLACQVCLGKVKDPVVCQNHHVFCSACMTQWLKSSQSNMCPTCRVPITDKQPCKRIIGSMDCSPTVQDKSIKEHMRKARFEILYQEYESEIKGLEQRMEEIQAENLQIKEINNDLKTRLDSAEQRSSTALKSGGVETQDINTILKLSSRLQDMINYNKSLKEENENYKSELQNSKHKNGALKEELEKHVQSNSYTKSPQRYSRYVMAALQTKVDDYEREVARLRKALQRSDEHIDELKRKVDATPQSPQHDAATQLLPREASTSESAVRNYASFSSELGVVASSSCGERAASSRNLVDTQGIANTALQVSRIDELANIALAAGDDLPPTIMQLQHLQQQQTPPRLRVSTPFDQQQPAMHSGLLSGDTVVSCDVSGSQVSDINERSIFEDSSKFPACAKLIELTKVRRTDAADQVPDSPQNAVTPSPSSVEQRETTSYQQAPNERSNLMSLFMQQAAHNSSSNSNSPISGATMIGGEGSAFSVVNSQIISRSSASLSLANLQSQQQQQQQLVNCNMSSPQSEVSSDDGPPSMLKEMATDSSSSTTRLRSPTATGSRRCMEGESRLSQSYPSSIVFENSRPSFLSDNDEAFVGKRIKIEQQD